MNVMSSGGGISRLWGPAIGTLLALNSWQWSIRSLEARPQITPEQTGNPILHYDVPPPNIAASFLQEPPARVRPVNAVSFPLYGSVSNTAYWFADVFFGYPTAQRQSLIVDTGSSVTAFPCLDCQKRCGDHLDAAFNNTQGARGIDCVSRCFLCARTTSALSTVNAQTFHPRGEQGLSRLEGQCAYNIKYTEGSSLIGRWFEDHLWLKDSSSLGDVFESSQPGHPSSSRVPFGCHAEETHLFLNQEASGIMGLEVDNLYGPQSFVVSVLKELMNGGRPSHSSIMEGVEELRSYSINMRESTHPQPRLLFSMCLSNSGGVLTIGDSNDKLHVSPREASRAFGNNKGITQPLERGWKEPRTADRQDSSNAITNRNQQFPETTGEQSSAAASGMQAPSSKAAASTSQYSVRPEFSYELPPPLALDASAFLRYQDAKLGMPNQQSGDYGTVSRNPAPPSQASANTPVMGTRDSTAQYPAQFPAQYRVPEIDDSSNRHYIPVKQYIALQQQSTAVRQPAPPSPTFATDSTLMQPSRVPQNNRYNPDPPSPPSISAQASNLGVQVSRDFITGSGSSMRNPTAVNGRYPNPTYVTSMTPQLASEYADAMASTVNINTGATLQGARFPSAVSPTTSRHSPNNIVFSAVNFPKAGSVSGLRFNELEANDSGLQQSSVSTTDAIQSNQWKSASPYANIGHNPSLYRQREAVSGFQNYGSVYSTLYPGGSAWRGNSHIGSVPARFDASTRRRSQASRRPRLLQDSLISGHHDRDERELGSDDDIFVDSYYATTAETRLLPTPLVKGFEGNYLTFVERITVLGATWKEHDISLPLSRRSPAAGSRPSQLRVGLLSLADSGTTLTYLPLLVYSSFWASLMKNVLAAKEAFGSPVADGTMPNSGAFRRLESDSATNSREVVRLSGRPASYLGRRVRNFARRLQRRAKPRNLKTDIAQQNCPTNSKGILEVGADEGDRSAEEHCGEATNADDIEAEEEMIRTRALATARQVLQELEEVEAALESDARATADAIKEGEAFENEDLVCAPARILGFPSSASAATAATKGSNSTSGKQEDTQPDEGHGGNFHFSSSGTAMVRNSNSQPTEDIRRTVSGSTGGRPDQRVQSHDNFLLSETIKDGNQHSQKHHKNRFNPAAGSASPVIESSVFANDLDTDVGRNGGVLRCGSPEIDTGTCSDTNNLGPRWIDVSVEGEAAEWKPTTLNPSYNYIEVTQQLLLQKGSTGMEEDATQDTGATVDSEYFDYLGSAISADFQQATPLRRLEPVPANRNGEECWNLANGDKDFRYFPDLKLTFAAGVSYVWRPRSYLYQKNQSSVYCLTLVPKDEDEVIAAGESTRERRELNADTGENDTVINNTFRRQLQEDQEAAILGTGFFINHDIIFDLLNWSMSFSEATCPTTDLAARRAS